MISGIALSGAATRRPQLGFLLHRFGRIARSAGLSRWLVCGLVSCSVCLVLLGLGAPVARGQAADAGRPQAAAPASTRPSAPAAATPPAPAAQASVVPDRLVFATDAYCGSPAEKSKSCRLGDTLFVSFKNLKEWMGVSSNHLSEIALVLNGRVLEGITPRGPDDTYGGLEFDLKRLEGDDPAAKANRDTWNALVAQLRHDHWLRIAVASRGNPPFWGSATVQFVVFPNYTWAVIVFLLALLVGFVIMARRSDILRDAPTPAGGARQSYSLARCQMAWWFFIIAASFCYIWLTLGDYDSLTAGVLILTGISAGTGLASTAIDSSKREQRQTLAKEKAEIDAQLAALPGLIAAAPAADQATLVAEQQQKMARLAVITASLASLPSAVGTSEGLLRDILRDESGISFHRFQMAAWTLILGFVFVSAVNTHLSMPDFSATLLGLMGISSGTYVGFKIPEPPK